MTAFSLITFVCFSIFTSAHGFHQLCQSVACFDTGDTQITATFDDDEILYIDFKNESVVYDSKIPVVYRIFPYDLAIYAKTWCMHHLSMWKGDPSLEKTIEPPEVLIYTRDDVIEQIDNTLICFVRNFFPPTVEIKWTKNREVVASDNPFEKMILNSDGMFHVFSTMSFVPKGGDVYSCIVEHQALDAPIVRFFEFDAIETDNRPTIGCIVCLTLGTIEFVAGVFFFVRGNQQYPA